ncbi:MAG: acyltransferase [Prevotella sp.]|nr:acyltransferase [Bacteroides sp.]MCM1367176.1 acyltransferase [Prevotella sp.]MCM1437085.1 acyltransferase [Prevotella sp.]
MILPLQSLRGIFALLIFVHHYTVYGKPMIYAGNISVVFFMMLSGTMLTIGYGRKCCEEKFSYWNFILKRIARIYPVYLLTLIGSIILFPQNHHETSIVPLILDVFMLQGWIPLENFYFSGNPPSWCIADFLFFYLIFPPLYRCAERYPISFFIGVLAILTAYFSLTPFLPSSLLEPIIYISPIVRSIDFIIGIIICRYFILSKREIKQSRKRATVLETAAILLTALFYSAQDYIPTLYENASWYWIPVGILIYTFARRPYGEGVWSDILCMRCPVKLGEVSYCIYLIGYLCIMTTKLISLHFGININTTSTMLVSMGITILASLLMNRIIEQPVSKMLGRLCK